MGTNPITLQNFEFKPEGTLLHNSAGAKYFNIQMSKNLKVGIES